MENKRLQALFDNACPSIRVRAREEIYRSPLSDGERQQFYRELMENPRVQTVLGWQSPDGYFGERLHTPPAKSRVWPHEGCVRFLLEMGFRPDFPPLRRALDAMLRDGWGKECDGSPAAEAFGYPCIRASLFAQAGLTGDGIDAELQEWSRTALSAFSCVAETASSEDMTYVVRGKHAFRAGKTLPTIYMLRVLAYTGGWRTPENLAMLRRAYKKLYDWLPLPPSYIRNRSGLVAPAGSIIMPLNADASDPLSFWWFSFYELSARMGLLEPDSPFRPHLENLALRLRQNGGFFLDDFSKNGWVFWSGYSGMALENDWKIRQKRVNDLTFRSQLIFALAGMDELSLSDGFPAERQLGVRI